MIAVTFTQFLRPDGERRPMVTTVSQDLKHKVDEILDHGFHFEIEELTEGTVHMTITDEHADYYSRLCANGPPVPANVDALIRCFNLDYALALRGQLIEEETVH